MTLFGQPRVLDTGKAEQKESSKGLKKFNKHLLLKPSLFPVVFFAGGGNQVIIQKMVKQIFF